VAPVRKEAVPSVTSLFVYDLPGVMGFVAGFDTIPADGLMSDQSYEDAVLSEGITSYLSTRGIRHFMGVGPAIRRGQPKDPCSSSSVYLGATRYHCRETAPNLFAVEGVTIYAPLYGREVGYLSLRDKVVVASFDFDGRTYSIWELEASNGGSQPARAPRIAAFPN